MYLKMFKMFEADSDFGKTDRDIDLDDVQDKETQVELTSDEDSANEKEFDNLHSAVEELINTTVKEEGIQKEELVKKVADEGIDAGNLKKFTNENDIYDFYLEHRLEIDEKLNDIDFFDDAPAKYGSRSLYDYVVQGSKVSVESLIVDMN